MLIFRFEEIKMLENETFCEFYIGINDLRNSMVSLGKRVSDVKLRIKVTFIEESKDLDSMKIEELVGSLQTYEYSLPPVKKAKGMAFKATKSKVSLDEDSDNEEELAMIANRINKLMKTDKFIKRLRETPNEAEPEEDPRGHRCCEFSGFGHMRTECANLKRAKGKAYIATLSDEFEKEEESPENFLACVAPHENQDDLHYSEHSHEKVKEEYCVLYMELMKLRESNHKKVMKMNTTKTEKDTLLLVFVLATFCWTKSLLCNVAAFTEMLLYPESTLHLCSLRRFCEVFKEVHFGFLSAVLTTWYSVRTLINQQLPSERCGIPSGRPSVSRSFEQFKFASVQT
jgi:hypothetical protein